MQGNTHCIPTKGGKKLLMLQQFCCFAVTAMFTFAFNNIVTPFVWQQNILIQRFKHELKRLIWKLEIPKNIRHYHDFAMCIFELLKNTSKQVYSLFIMFITVESTHVCEEREFWKKPKFLEGRVSVTPLWKYHDTGYML